MRRTIMLLSAALVALAMLTLAATPVLAAGQSNNCNDKVERGLRVSFFRCVKIGPNPAGQSNSCDKNQSGLILELGKCVNIGV